ncbi:MAG: GIY-YIG nuclease family protein [Bacteroidia bacterium]|nr:GIY-YIG nuclease family protein [Bacteroidia bacterium]
MGLYVYILKCSDDSFYTGVTNNIENRVEMHNSGMNKDAYTHCRRPVSLEWFNYFPSNMEAIRWEKKIKGWTRKKKQALIDDKFDLLHELSECKNETNYKISLRLRSD